MLSSGEHDAGAQEEAITELLNALVIHGAADLSPETTLREAFLEREKVASPGIGSGLAVPHIKSKFADKMTVGVGISDQGIDFGAHDNQAARIIVMWICAPAETQTHLGLMRGLAAWAATRTTSRRSRRRAPAAPFLAEAEQISVEK